MQVGQSLAESGNVSDFSLSLLCLFIQQLAKSSVTQMALECTICDPRSQKISGGDPQTPLKEDVSFRVHLTNMCMHY